MSAGAGPQGLEHAGQALYRCAGALALLFFIGNLETIIDLHAAVVYNLVG